MMTTSSAPPRSRYLLSTCFCWIAIIGFVALMLNLQARSARQAALVATTTSLPNLGLEITGRLAVAQSQQLENDKSPDAVKRAQTLRSQLLTNLRLLAISPLDKLKSIPAIHELQGNNTALKELDADDSTFNSDPQLRTDAQSLRSIYQTSPNSISKIDRQALIDHLGWFGQLAVTQGLPENDSTRIAILRTAHNSFITMVTLLVGILVAVGLGFLLLILLIVFFAVGKLHFTLVPTSLNAPPMFLESFTLWAAAYLALSLVLHRFKTGASPLVFEVLFAIVSFLVALWPLRRGITWTQLRHSLGWHTGRGVLSEITAGFLGYLAGLPLIAIGVLFTLILSRLGNANPTHPIQQELAKSLTPLKIMSLLVMISVAAPFLEETLFRGALYMHLRRRWRPWISAGLVAVIFAAIHPQGWAAIPVLASIAIVLAMLREWRGSLIASITAHGINNGIVLLSVVLMLR